MMEWREWFRCVFYHRWGSWKVIDRGNILWRHQYPVGQILIQERVCEDCDKRELDMQQVQM